MCHTSNITNLLFLASQYTTRSFKNINYIRNAVCINVAAVVRQKEGRKTSRALVLLLLLLFPFETQKKCSGCEYSIKTEKIDAVEEREMIRERSGKMQRKKGFYHSFK